MGKSVTDEIETMLVGLDFDNTIVCYDAVFHAVALERKLIGDDVAVSKLAVRDCLRQTNREDEWTEMQGYVYGARMADAEPFDGAVDVLRWASRSDRIDLVIISHKTRYPFAGYRYDLHSSARRWIDEVLRDDCGGLFEPGQVNFLETKEEKVAVVGQLGCAMFVDDLPEILGSTNFPDRTRRVLFDPDRHHAGLNGLERVSSWLEIRALLDS